MKEYYERRPRFECWLIVESNGRRHLLSDYEFKERYEPAGKKKKHGPQS